MPKMQMIGVEMFTNSLRTTIFSIMILSIITVIYLIGVFVIIVSFKPKPTNRECKSDNVKKGDVTIFVNFYHENTKIINIDQNQFKNIFKICRDIDMAT